MTKLLAKINGQERIVKSITHIEGKTHEVICWNGDSFYTDDVRPEIKIQGQMRRVMNITHQQDNTFFIKCWNGDAFVGTQHGYRKIYDAREGR